MSPRTNLELHLFVGVRFQVYFTPLTGVLFTFPSRYWFTIGRRGVFSLGSWSTQFPTGFHVPRSTREHLKEVTNFSPTGLSPSMAARSRDLLLNWGFITSQNRPRPPDRHRLRFFHLSGLGSSAFARRY